MDEMLSLWDSRENAKEEALKYISRQLRTGYEVWEHLRKKNFVEEDIQSAVLFLQEYGYLNDENYCKSWIRDRITFHPCGRIKMEQELKKKIPNQRLIRQCLEDVFPEETEEQLAVNAALQKLKSVRKIKKEQLIRFLLGRGYSLSVAYCALQDERVAVLLEAIQEKNPEENDISEYFLE